MSNEVTASPPAKPSPWLSYAFSLVGVLMFLGGVALFLTRLREGLLAPDAPLETDVAHLREHMAFGA